MRPRDRLVLAALVPLSLVVAAIAVTTSAASREPSSARSSAPVAASVQGPDRTAPEIVARSPADGSPDAPLAGPLVIGFSEPLDAAALGSATVLLADAAGTPVEATATAGTAASELVVRPVHPLHPTSEYRLTVDGVHDLAGNAMRGSSSWSFTTVGALLAAGDIAVCGTSTGQQAVTAELLAGLEGEIATLGDNAYDTGSAAEFAGCFAPSWGRFLPRIHPATGNHEYLTPGASGYFGYFGAAAGDPARGFYSYDIAGWHVVALNSNCSFVSCAVGSEQERWLAADLAAHPALCGLALWHHPRFSSGRYSTNSAVLPLVRAFYAAGGDLMLNGHEHSYERFAPQTPEGVADPIFGVREIIAGTGGAGLRNDRPNPAANSEVWNGTTHGVLQLALRSDGYDWQFVPVPGATFGDAGAASCHGAPGGLASPLIWRDDFGAGGLRAWIVARAGGARAVVQPSVARSGRAVLLTSTTGRRSSATISRAVSPALAELTVTADVQVIAADRRRGRPVVLLTLADASGTAAVMLKRDGRTGEAFVRAGSARIAIGSIPLGRWLHLEVHVRLAGVGSLVEVRRDGLLAARAVVGIPAPSIARIVLGTKQAARTSAIAYDDVGVRASPLP